VHSVSARRKTIYACLGLAGLSLALYAGALCFSFINFDDQTVLLAHPDLYNQASFLASLHQIFVTAFPREEPLLARDLSWALDARLFGFANPFGYHLGNVLLNAVNTVLAFLLLFRATRRFELALVVAGAFAVVPVHVEPVCWVMGRKDLLSTTFVLSALLAQALELESTSALDRRLWYAAGLAATALALLAKISAMSCVLLLALHWTLRDHLAGKCRPDSRLAWRRLVRDIPVRFAPHALLTVSIVAWYQRVIAQYGVIGWRGRGPLDPVHLANVAIFTPLVVGHYVRSLVWPTDLSIFYRWPHVEIPLSRLEQVGALAIALALLTGILYCCRHRRDLAFYALSFLALLFPYMGFVFVDIWSADRYIYLASLCPLAIVGTLLLQVYARSRRALRWATVALLVGFDLGSGAATLQHEAVWQDDDALWSYEAYRQEPSLQAIQSLAKLYVKRAERETDPARRQDLTERAHAEIARGFQRDRELGRRPSGYATNEQLQLSRLYVLEGRLAALEGEPLERQLAAYQAAHRIAPNAVSAFRLAQVYLQLAEESPAEDRERLIRASFDHFLEYIAQTGSDPIRRRRDEAMLTTLYEKPYPFLSDDVLAARRTYFQ
jgi:hypothetical protein